MTAEGYETRTPKVHQNREFLEITRDFTNPKEAIREAISNAVDWGAKKIEITVSEDKTRPDEELVLEIHDNGIGLNEQRLEAFFDLGWPVMQELPQSEKPVKHTLGEKGHGTKTYFNSREIEVSSSSGECTVHAIMQNPLQALINNKIPEYRFKIKRKKNQKTFAHIKIRSYNMNKNRSDFAHNILKDYILWFTRFGSVEREFGVKEHEKKVLYLRGLGRETPEKIEFGHRFPRENANIEKLQKKHPVDWTKIFVKKWIFSHEPIIGNPSKFIDLVFYIEGDDAKRSYNPMIRGRGRPSEEGKYKVEDRYGLWTCKDHIPIKRVNEWLGLGKRLETKYHAFVNCQEFKLTANRSDIGNTPTDLLNAIADTVKQVFEHDIIQSSEHQDYEEAAELEEKYQTAEQEHKDFERRSRRMKTKKVCKYENVELIEPSVEMGVIALFNLVYSLKPTLFPFRVVDYDSKRGYDALVVQQTVHDLSKESTFFVEFKYKLTGNFDHSFDHLAAVICWDCAVGEGTEVMDIKNKKRTLRVTPASDTSEYTRYMLVGIAETHNIEVFVLKDYLKEKLGLEFRARSSQ